MPVSLTELDDDDIPPVGSDDTAPLRCASDGCHNTLDYSGKGRRPKFCDEHKASKGASARSNSRWAKASQVEESLNQFIINGSVLVLNLANQKTDALIVENNGPKVIHEIVELAKVDKNLRVWLERLATPGKYGPLIAALGALILPILFNHGVMGNLFPKAFTEPTEGRV